MNGKTKTATFIILFLTATLLFGQSIISCISAIALPETDLKNQALTCLTGVFNLDFNHYNITPDKCITLPSSPNSTALYQSVNYFLLSADSNLVATFVFKEGVMCQVALRTINGTAMPAQDFPNITAAAIDFMTKYQALSSSDLTPLICLLNNLNQDNTTTATTGTLTISEGSGSILPGHYITGFGWLNTINNASTHLTFDNGVFYNFYPPSPEIADGTQSLNSPIQDIASTQTFQPTQTSNLPIYPRTEQQNQNPTTAANVAPPNHNTGVAVIATLLAVISVCACIIIYMRRHKR